MSEIVHLEIIDIPQTGRLPASLPDDLLGGDIAVRLLSSPNQVNIFLQPV